MGDTVTTIKRANVGKDASIVLAGSDGSTYNQDDLGILTHVEIKGKIKHIETDSMTQGGKTWNNYIVKGAVVTIKVKRNGAGMTNLLKAAWNASLAGTDFFITPTLTVKNDDGTFTEISGDDGVPVNFDFGIFNADNDVPQDLELHCTGLTFA